MYFHIASILVLLVDAVTVEASAPPETQIINGLDCPISDVVVVDDHGCDQGAPHFDYEGMVCANDGQPDEGYCSYDISPTACAYCSSKNINGYDCPVSDVVVVDEAGCDQGAPHFDYEGMVCANDGQPDEGYCSYDISPTSCAYCSKNICHKTCDYNPCTPEAIAAGKFFFEHCKKRKYLQCDAFGQCFTKKCPKGTVWKQEFGTCVEKKCGMCRNACKFKDVDAGNYYRKHCKFDSMYQVCDDYGGCEEKGCPSDAPWDNVKKECVHF